MSRSLIKSINCNYIKRMWNETCFGRIYTSFGTIFVRIYSPRSWRARSAIFALSMVWLLIPSTNNNDVITSNPLMESFCAIDIKIVAWFHTYQDFSNNGTPYRILSADVGILHWNKEKTGSYYTARKLLYSIKMCPLLIK